MRAAIACLCLAAAGCPRSDAPEAPRPRATDDGGVPAMLHESRDAVMKPDALVARLRLRPGDRVADIGAGPGYLTLRLARAVGPTGEVIATDVDRAALDLLSARARAAGLANIAVRPVAAADPGLAPASVDLALLSHVHAFIPDLRAWLARLRPSLRPGGRVAVVSWIAGRAALLDAARDAGYRLADEDPALLPMQFFVVLAPR